jgi:hypothetical protein
MNKKPYPCNPVFSQKVEYPYPSLEIKFRVESDSKFCFVDCVHFLTDVEDDLKIWTFCSWINLRPAQLFMTRCSARARETCIRFVRKSCHFWKNIQIEPV